MTVSGRIYGQVTWVLRIGGRGYGLWRTPDTCAGGVKSREQYEKAKKTGCNAIRLQDQVKHERMLPTPRATDWKSGGWHRKDRQDSLTGVAKYGQRVWPTPTGRDHKDGCNVENVPENGLLGRAVEPTKMSGSLDPGFVEYLMGYPVGWTDLKGSGIALSLKSRKSCSDR
jgi:hypothetical protein